MYILHTVLYIQEWFVWQLRVSSVGDHFLYPCDLPVWFMVDSVGRNKMLVSSKWLIRVVTIGLMKYSIWPGERLVWVCWTTYRPKWSNTNAMDTKLKKSYLTGHHVLCDIPNNYCTGVNRHDTLMLSSPWQPKQGLYPEIRQWRSVCVLFHEWGRVWKLRWWRMDTGHEDQ